MDVAKGLAILMVVIHHGVMALDGLDLLPAAVTYVNYSLAAFRMPLLMLASGLFAGRVIAASWRTVLHRRIAHYAHLYVVWALLYFVVFSLVERSVAPRPEGLSELVSWLWAPGTSLWFIYGLAVATVAVKLVSGWPVWCQIGAAALLAVAAESPLFEGVGFAWQSICAYGVFFVIGVRCGPGVLASASRATPPAVVGWGVLAALPLLATAALDLHEVPGSALLRALAFTAFLVGACVLFDRTRAARGLRWLGGRTLDVYVLHPLWIALVTAPLIGREVVEPGAQGIALLVVLVVSAIAVSLWCGRQLRRVRAGWLFALPLAWRWTPAETGRPAVVRASGR